MRLTYTDNEKCFAMKVWCRLIFEVSNTSWLFNGSTFGLGQEFFMGCVVHSFGVFHCVSQNLVRIWYIVLLDHGYSLALIRFRFLHVLFIEPPATPQTRMSRVWGK